MVRWLNNGALNEQWCAKFLIIDKAFWVLDLESIVLYCMVAMSNILQSSLSSCWRVLLQTFLSPDNVWWDRSFEIDAFEGVWGSRGVASVQIRCRQGTERRSEVLVAYTHGRYSPSFNPPTRDCQKSSRIAVFIVVHDAAIDWPRIFCKWRRVYILN